MKVFVYRIFVYRMKVKEKELERRLRELFGEGERFTWVSESSRYSWVKGDPPFLGVFGVSFNSHLDATWRKGEEGFDLVVKSNTKLDEGWGVGPEEWEAEEGDLLLADFEEGRYPKHPSHPEGLKRGKLHGFFVSHHDVPLGFSPRKLEGEGA